MVLSQFANSKLQSYISYLVLMTFSTFNYVFNILNDMFLCVQIMLVTLVL